MHLKALKAGFSKVNIVGGCMIFADWPGFAQKVIHVPANVPSAEELPEARYICKLHNEGRDAGSHYIAMQLAAKVSAARRMLRLQHGLEAFPVFSNQRRLCRMSMTKANMKPAVLPLRPV